MPYNLVMLSGTIVSEIEYIEHQPGKYVALFRLGFITGKQDVTMLIAAYDNVGAFCNNNLKKGSPIVIKIGNISQYNGETEIIANSIDIVDSSGKVLNSVKKESRKGWSGAAAPDKATAAEKPAGESFDDLLERIAKIEKMLSDAGKSHEK
jgi:single-stranded DNA-binding protein